MRPIIGISSEDRVVESTVVTADCVSVAREYARCVWDAGGLPVVLPVLEKSAASDTTSHLDGLVLTGGGDLDPVWYGETPHPKTYDIQAERDAYEMALLDSCTELGIPVLAICRGQQLVNAHRGGTLQRHLDSDQVDHWQMNFDPAHSVSIDPSSRLAEIFGAGEREVNSFHHQGLGTVGERLRPVAHSTDGTVEAIESTDDHWLIAVQWHPERPWPSPRDDSLIFDALIDQAGRRLSPTGSQQGSPHA